jgi:PhnB protein
MLAVHDGAAAIRFYEDVFGATEETKILSDDGKVAHCELRIGNAALMVADEFEGHNRAARRLGGTSVILYLDVDDADRVARRAVSAGATLLRPVEPQPHGARVGKIEDPFGHVWMVASEG